MKSLNKVRLLLLLLPLTNFLWSQNQDSVQKTNFVDEKKILQSKMRALDKATAERDSLAMAGALSDIGLCYQRISNYPKSIEATLRSYSIFEKLKHLEGMGRTLGTISLIYQAQSDYKKALDYNMRALKCNQEAGFKQGIARNHMLMGVIYQLLSDYEKALEYDLKAIELNKAIKNRIGVVKSTNNAGNIYELQGQFDKAFEFYLTALNLSRDNRNKTILAMSYKNLGSLYYSCSTAKDSSFLLKQLDGNRKRALELAHNYVDSSMTVDKKLGNLNKLKDDYLMLSVIDERRGDFKSALQSFRYYAAIKDTVFSSENNNVIIQSALQYEFARKEDSLNLEKQKGELEYKKQLALKALAFEYERKQALARTEKEKQKLELEHQIKEQAIQNEYALNIQRAEALQKQKELEQKQAEAIKNAEQEKKDTRQKNIRNILIASFSLLMVIFVLIYRNYRQKAKANIVLAKQKELIEQKNKEITDSINYAQRIQHSLLANEKVLKANLGEYFIFFKPKDIVSGDFYWTHSLPGNKFLVVTADSTGHGVPGSIMSMLNMACLKEAIESFNLYEPDQIFDRTRKIIIETLANDGSAEGGKDGMDASATLYDFKEQKLVVSAANNPVWIVRGKETIEVKPDKMPIGKHDRQGIPFTQHVIDLQKGDVVYTLTDGFPDQFGGPNGKKFMSKNLRELLAKNAHLPMHEQRAILEKTFSAWIGDLEQVDDVTIIGVRV